MEFDIKAIGFDADEYDVRKALELVLHGPDLYDPNNPKNKGRKPNFEVVLGKSPAGRIHNGTGILRVPNFVGNNLHRWITDSKKNKILVKERALRIFRTSRPVSRLVKQQLEKAFYVGPEKEKQRKTIENQTGQALRVAKVQFGVWYRQPNSPPNQGRAFSIEYERDFLSQSAAYISVVYEHKLIRIDIGQRETEEHKYTILVKFSTIRKLGTGHDDFGQPVIVFDLRFPPVFEGEGFNSQELGDRRNTRHKTRDRLVALNDGHARIAPYVYHICIVLFDQVGLEKFREICEIVECQPRPVHVHRVYADKLKFFEHNKLYHVERWLKTMDWKVAFQIDACLRGDLLTPHDILFTLRDAIERVIRDHGSSASQLLRTFFLELQNHKGTETPSSCLARVCAENSKVKPLQLSPGHVLCYHVIITPSRMLLEGPYATQSNRVIRRYQEHNPALVERFLRVEFCDEDRLAYRWDRDVDGSWFVQRRVGGILHNGFEVSGRSFEFLAYSQSSLREHAVWFVSPFEDPVEGYVNAESIRAHIGDLSDLMRTPSKYAARIAQAFTSTDPSVKIPRHQWEEQAELGVHTDGVGTISQELADKIWEEKCRATDNLRENRVKPSVYQFRFRGYKGVVVVDSQLEGVKMRLRGSQCKFPVYDEQDVEFEIAGTFDTPIPVHLNRPMVMVLEDRGVRKEAFIDLQDAAKAEVCLAEDSLINFRRLLKSHSLGNKFHLSFILEQLHLLGLDLRNNGDKRAIESAFFRRLLRCSMVHVLREIKFKARIPVPNSYQLVGVADEGQAYIREGVDPEDIFTLPEGHIFACVQESVDKDPIYLKGTCMISRSPVIHPGDVLRVKAVGKPPDDKICFFRGLKNVVVLPAVGERSLASCLAGGDVDGDTYDIYYQNPALLPGIQTSPADYPPGEYWTLEEGCQASIEHVCQFIVEYINSDVMGLIAQRHMVIADQSKDGVFDNSCMVLAKVHNQAVDYPKKGVPVNITNDFPRPLIKFKPDWNKAEVTGAHEVDYYESDRALGHLFRNIHLDNLGQPPEGFPGTTLEQTPPLGDVISQAIAPIIHHTLDIAVGTPEAENEEAKGHYDRFLWETRCICMSHTLLDLPNVQLTEEEVVLGVILAKSTQPRLRKDRAYRMRLHAETLVRDIRARIVPAKEGERTEMDFRDGLQKAWATWGWAQHHRDKEYIESFSLVVLGVILDCLRKLGALPSSS